MRNHIQKYLLILLFFSSIQAVTGQIPALQDSLTKGNQLYTSGKYTAAVKTYEAISAKGFESFELYYNLGNAYSDMGRLAQAIENYKIALTLKPGFAEAHNNLGIAYAQSGMLDQAIEHFEASIQLNPDEQNFRNNLARAITDKKRLR